MASRTIAFCTGTRADYGLLKPLIDRVRTDDSLSCELYVTGMHLSTEFGCTVKEIKRDGIDPTEEIEILLSADTQSSVIKSMGLVLLGYSDIFKRRHPDLLVILGDRFEAFCVAAAATVARIPIAHIHGGELTEGAVDDAFRHSITKMSLLHFAATEEYRKRIIRMGEDPVRVFNVGSLGIENIKNLPLLNRKGLQQELGITLPEKYILVTFHPATLELEPASVQFENLLEALDLIPNMFVIFTKANADASGRGINMLIDEYVANNPRRSVTYTNLGQLRYLSTMKYADAVIGNSSSGIIEAPSFGIPTVNIGRRQQGRVRARSVIDCDATVKGIQAAISLALSEAFRKDLSRFDNPYEGGLVSETILNLIKDNLDGLSTVKTFFEGSPL